MFMNTIARSFTVLAIAALSSWAQAGSNTPQIDQREAKQQARIAEGANSGALTVKETLHLEREQARINTVEAKAKSDGAVTHQERRKLHAMQDKASRDIHHAKHNGRVAGQ